MAHGSDLEFALALHKRLNGNVNNDDSDIEAVDFLPPPRKKPYNQPRSNQDDDYLNRTQNLVHPDWETLDPTPDVFVLFSTFDDKFFQSRLKCVSLEWSKKMYSCAGICYSKRNRFGKDITIRLSEPLLKLRPRKDLVETMLHEMIHAYCFVLNIREGNGGHGPNFKKIMNAINKVAGTNITVYHTFHDEVQLYKQHWWRCNGSCQYRAPFFGYVKRTTNRAPGSYDQWWATHKENCGGTFLKIKSPDTKGKNHKTGSKKTTGNDKDIRKYFNPSSDNNIKGFNNINGGIKGPIKMNGGGTLLVNPKTTKIPASGITNSNPISTAFPPTSYPGLSSNPLNTGNRKTNGDNLSNVHGFGGPIRPSSNSSEISRRIISGNGYSLVDRTNTHKSIISTQENSPVDRNHLRNVWSKRFENARNNNGNLDKDTENSPKVPENKNDNWIVLDNDLMMNDPSIETVSLFSDEEDSDEGKAPIARAKPQNAEERQRLIKQEIMDETTDLQDNDIILIDDEYDDSQDFIAAAEIADTSIVDEFFGEDTLLNQFVLENDVRPSGSRNYGRTEDEIITCPICQSKMKRNIFAEHLDGCTGVVVKIQPPKHALNKIAVSPKPNINKPKIPSRLSRQHSKDILRKAGYTNEDLEKCLTVESSDEEDFRRGVKDTPLSSTFTDEGNENSKRFRQRNVNKSTVQCPSCAREIEADEINEHIDDCLINKSTKDCPVCGCTFDENELNDHVNDCLDLGE